MLKYSESTLHLTNEDDTLAFSSSDEAYKREKKRKYTLHILLLLLYFHWNIIHILCICLLKVLKYVHLIFMNGFKKEKRRRVSLSCHIIIIIMIIVNHQLYFRYIFSIFSLPLGISISL